MDLNFLVAEQVLVRREKPKQLIIGNDGTEEELGGELGLGAAKFSTLRGRGKVAGELAEEPGGALHIKNPPELRLARHFGDNRPVKGERIGVDEEAQQIQSEIAEDAVRRGPGR